MSGEVNYIGKQISNYRVISEVGSGTFSRVYQAQHIIFTERPVVAIKLLHSHLALQREQEEFLQEARLLEYLKHPHILSIIDAGIQDGFPYFVTEYASNGSLRDRLRKQTTQPLPLEEALTILSQIGEALQYAHQHDIVHRDVKPENILFNAKGEALLADFGIAILLNTIITGAGPITGTPAYMAPEQLQGSISRASDQYALGCISYELMTGHQPFVAINLSSLVQMQLHEEPKPLIQLNPKVPIYIEQATLKALAKDHKHRHSDISNFIVALSASPRYVALSSQNTKEMITYSIHQQLADMHQISNPIDSSPTIYPVINNIPPLDICPYCSAKIGPSDQFCLNCGNRVYPTTPLPQQTAQQTISAHNPSSAPIIATRFEKCPYCNADTRDGDKLCMNCGNRLSSATSLPEQVENQSPLEQDGWEAPPPTIATRFMSTATDAPPDDPSTASVPIETPIQEALSTSRPSGKTIAQLFEEGEFYYKKGKRDAYKKALVIYEEIIQREPRNTIAHGKKGNVLGKLRDYKKALEAYDAALGIDSEHASIWNAKGDILSRMERYEEAVVAYDRALELKPKDVLTWTTKGDVLFKLGKYEDALEAYNSALNITLKKAAIWDAKGEVLYKLGRYEEALEAHSRAEALDPYNATICSKCERLRDLIKERKAKREEEQVKRKTAGHQVADQNKTRAFYFSTTSADYSQTQRAGELSKQSAESTGAEHFDVFVSHADLDTKWVEEQLAMRLRSHGFHIWLDKWSLIPGRPEQQARARGIEQANCCAVCISEHTPRGWFKREIEKALDRQTKFPSFGVIPVFLPNAKEVVVDDDFLELNTLVDFRNADFERAFYLLACGVQGIAPGPPNAATFSGTSTPIEEMLLDLRRLRQSDLITDSVKEDYIRIIMERVWFAQWPLKGKDSKK